MEHLGIEISAYGGATFLWTDEVPATTTWSLLPENTTYFGPGDQRVMINYRVDDLDALSLPSSPPPASQ